MLLSRKKLVIFLTIASFLFVSLSYPLTADSAGAAVAGLVVKEVVKKGGSYVVKAVIRNRKVIAEVSWEAGKWAVEKVIERADIELPEISDYFSGLSREDIVAASVTVAGAAAAVTVSRAVAAGTVAAAGTTAGLTAAGVTSGLAGIGAVVGGGMAVGTAVVVAAPIAAAAAVGGAVYWLFSDSDEEDDK